MVIGPIYKSLVRHIHDFQDAVPFETTYWSWEQRGEEDKFPKTTMIGLDGFNFNENRGLWIVRFSVAISTYEDFNLHNEVEILGLAHEWFGYEKKVPMRDLDTGDEHAEMVIKEFEIAPMQQTMLRNYRVISLEMHRTTAEV